MMQIYLFAYSSQLHFMFACAPLSTQHLGRRYQNMEAIDIKATKERSTTLHMVSLSFAFAVLISFLLPPSGCGRQRTISTGSGEKEVNKTTRKKGHSPSEQVQLYIFAKSL